MSRTNVIEVQMVLLFSDSNLPVKDQSILSYDPAHLFLREGTASIPVNFTKLSMTFNNRPFRIQIKPKSFDAHEVLSSEICVVKEKLTLVEDAPELWYKDEGGKEKCMDIAVQVQSPPHTRPENRIIPLSVSLLYENEEPVLKQQILKLYPDLRPNLTNGFAKISFRIDDVSKNHQNQSFRVLIQPDNAENVLYYSLSDVMTNAINVRSKRNKRRLSKQSSSSSLDPINSFKKPNIKQEIQDDEEEWRLVGYEFQADGSQDLSRPLYRCLQCNRYKDSTSSSHDDQCIFTTRRILHSSPKTTIIPSLSELQYNGTASDINNLGPPPLVRQTSDMTVDNNSNSILNATSAPICSESATILPPYSNLAYTPPDVAPVFASASQPPMMSNINSANSTVAWISEELDINLNSNNPEHNVHYILAKMYKNEMGENMGLPAFDHLCRLLGFYKEGQSETRTQVYFIPACNVIFSLRDTNIVNEMIQREMKLGSTAVHSLSNFNGNLIRLQEDALMYYWSHSLMVQIPQ